MKSDHELLQRVAQGTPVAMLVSRASDGLVLVANNQAADALGVSAESLIGGHTPDFYARPGDRDILLGMLRAGEPIRDHEVEVRRADGSRFFAGATITPMRVDDSDGFLACFVDLTARRALAAAEEAQRLRERRRADAQVRRAEARSRAIVEALQDMVFVLTRDGHFADFTGPPDQPTHVPVEAFIGKHIAEVLPPPVSSACLGAMERAIETGQSQIAEYELDSPGIGRFWEARLVPAGDDEILGLVRNVTSQVESRSALAEKNKDLMEQQKLDAVGQLAGGIAHDFNNSLSVVLGLATLAAQDVAEDSQIHRDLLEIVGATRRAAALTQHLLAFSRRHIAQPQDLDINEATLALEASLARTLGPEIELRIDPSPAPLRTIIDPTQYEQVLQNLAANARDAMPEGGRLHIGISAASLIGFQEGADGEPATDYVLLTVSDSGGGMDADVLKHLFEPFFTTRPLGQGAGLGLATCYGIIRQAGGRIQVRSEPGQGSTFIVYLPLHDPSAAVVAPTPARTPSVAGHETVLLAEGDPAVLSLAMRALRRGGYVVLAAANGDDALRVSRRHPGHIDVLLAESVMPRMNGVELAEVLRQERPGLRVVISTGGYAEHLQEMDIDGILFKPFTAEQLLNVVRRTLDELKTARAPSGRKRLQITGGGVDKQVRMGEPDPMGKQE